MGTDKAWLALGGEPLVGRVARALTAVFGRVRIIANDPERFRSLHLPVQPDLYPGRGPLGGIHTALATADHDLVFVAACDLPFLAGDFVRALAELVSDHDAVVPRPEQVPIPVCALYRTSCLPVLEECLARGELKAADFLERIDVHWVEGEGLARLDPDGLNLMNVNTPEDLDRARLAARFKPPSSS